MFFIKAQLNGRARLKSINKHQSDDKIFKYFFDDFVPIFFPPQDCMNSLAHAFCFQKQVRETFEGHLFFYAKLNELGRNFIFAARDGYPVDAAPQDPDDVRLFETDRHY